MAERTINGMVKSNGLFILCATTSEAAEAVEGDEDACLFCLLVCVGEMI